MQINVRGANLEVTPALREHVEKKLRRLRRYFDDAPEEIVAHVTLRVVRNQSVVEVTVPMPGLILRAEVRHADMYAAIDLVIDKLERQVRKYKTRLNRKPRQEAAEQLPPVVQPEVEEEEEDTPYEVVRVKRFQLKPMDVEEAILQMDLLGHQFFVFSNINQDNAPQVVYKRHDGRYGLIEWEA